MDKKTKDKEYPIFSFRIDEEVYGELKEFKKKTGKSWNLVFKELLENK